MTNPNNAVGTNAAYSGRTSVNAFNDDLAAYGRGVLSGWACSPSTGLKVQLGGSGITRDVAVAVDNAGNRTTINNISGAPIEMTISAAPSTNSRIDAIVAYVDNPAEGVSTVTDNPAACGMIVVKGNAAASPVVPNESAIRSAITTDGASGVTAYYVVLATITIASGTTDLTSSNITAGTSAGIMAQNIDFTTLLPGDVAFGLKDVQNNGYVDNQSNGWYGYNLSGSIGTVEGACTLHSGSYTQNAIGGGAKLTNDAPKGLYFVTTEINLNDEGAANGYRAFRLCKGNQNESPSNTIVTGDLGVNFRGGSASANVFLQLKPGDIVNYQVYDSNTGRSVKCRIWLRGYLLRPTY